MPTGRSLNHLSIWSEQDRSKARLWQSRQRLDVILEIFRLFPPPATSQRRVRGIRQGPGEVQNGVVDPGLEQRDVGAEVQPLDARVGQEELVRLNGVFGRVVGVGDDEGHLAAGPQQLVGALQEGNVEVPLLVQGLVNAAGFQGGAIRLPLLDLTLSALFIGDVPVRGVGAHIGWVGDDDVEAAVRKHLGEFDGPVEAGRSGSPASPGGDIGPYVTDLLP